MLLLLLESDHYGVMIDGKLKERMIDDGRDGDDGRVARLCVLLAVVGGGTIYPCFMNRIALFVFCHLWLWDIILFL